MNTIAIQGIEDSYSYVAAKKLFSQARFSFHDTFSGALNEVVMGLVSYAVIPVFNSTIGNIDTALASVGQTSLEACNEITIEVDHVLATTIGVSLEQITNVRSHPAALSQCRRFLTSNPTWEQFEDTDTAASIRNVVSGTTPGAAAICSAEAARKYGAGIVLRGIADRDPNTTTFQVFRRK